MRFVLSACLVSLCAACVDTPPDDGGDANAVERVVVAVDPACDGTHEKRVPCAPPVVSSESRCVATENSYGTVRGYTLRSCECKAQRPGTTCDELGMESCYGTSCPAMNKPYTAYESTDAGWIWDQYGTLTACEAAYDQFCREQCDAHAAEGIGAYVGAMYCLPTT